MATLMTAWELRAQIDALLIQAPAFVVPVIRELLESLDETLRVGRFTLADMISAHAKAEALVSYLHDLRGPES